jgi:uncharacterized membrane protein YeiH
MHFSLHQLVVIAGAAFLTIFAPEAANPVEALRRRTTSSGLRVFDVKGQIISFSMSHLIVILVSVMLRD